MRVSVLALVFLAVFVLSSSSLADIPKVINYQGKVTDSGGTPVPDGSYDMRFRIFDLPMEGTLLWESGILSIQVTDGVFSVLLGDTEAQPEINLPFDEDY